MYIIPVVLIRSYMYVRRYMYMHAAQLPGGQMNMNAVNKIMYAWTLLADHFSVFDSIEQELYMWQD